MPSPDDRRVKMGEVVGVFGIHGWIKVFSHARPRESLFDYDEWLLTRGTFSSQFRLNEGKRQGKGLIAKLEGVNDRDEAAALVGSELSVPIDALPELAKGEYYWIQLEGLKVLDRKGQELGTVDHLLETGANDVMVVKSDREILIPYIPQVVKKVDLSLGIMEVDWDADY